LANKKELEMKKITLLLTAVFVLSAATIYAQQYDPESDFNVYPQDGRSVRITGYRGDKWTIRIPPRIRDLPVTHIGDGAFKGRNLISVIIPNSVTTIGEEAFANTQLSSITISNSVTRVHTPLLISTL
jgi:hypothetical protein